MNPKLLPGAHEWLRLASMKAAKKNRQTTYEQYCLNVLQQTAGMSLPSNRRVQDKYDQLNRKFVKKLFGTCPKLEWVQFHFLSLKATNYSYFPGTRHGKWPFHGF